MMDKKVPSNYFTMIGIWGTYVWFFFKCRHFVQVIYKVFGIAIETPLQVIHPLQLTTVHVKSWIVLNTLIVITLSHLWCNLWDSRQCSSWISEILCTNVL